jgi:amino acid transporter
MTADIDTASDAKDRGLVRALSAWGLAAAVANTVIGGGIFVLPSKMAAAVGTAAPVYYIACAVAVGAVAICFAEAGSRVAVSGGVSGGVEAAFGRYAGFITGVMLWLGAGLAAAGIAAGLADALASVVPVFAQPLWRGAFIALLFATIAAINIGGVRRGGGLVSLLIALKLIPLLVFVLVGALHASPAHLAEAGKAGHADIGRAMLLGVFAFMGMETALGVSGEVRRPERNVPLGLLGALAAVTVLYILIQLVAQGLLGAGLPLSKTPLADAMGRVSPALSGLLLVGGAVSMLGYLASDMLSAPRVLFGMARDGFLPAALAKAHPKAHTPHIAIFVYAVIEAAFAITGAFEPLVILSTLVTVVVYIAGCGAAVMLRQRGVAREGKPLNFPFTTAAAALGIGSMIWLTLQGTWQEGAAVIAAIAISSAIYFAALRRRT